MFSIIRIIQCISTKISISWRTGAGAVDYIIDHAEIDVVFIQDKKIKEVSSNKLFCCITLGSFA
jgi:hypothetical protein